LGLFGATATGEATGEAVCGAGSTRTVGGITHTTFEDKQPLLPETAAVVKNFRLEKFDIEFPTCLLEQICVLNYG